MKKRQWLMKIHTWLGLVALVPLLISCFTGALLVFKYEIDALLRDDMVQVDVLEQRLELDELRRRINQQLPDYEISGWVLFQQPERADVVYLIPQGGHEWHHVYVDGYRGEILSPPALATSYFTDWLLELHYTLLLDHVGLLISAIASSLLLLLGLSGLFIYRRFWKNLLRLRLTAARTTMYVDTHSSFGMTLAPVFLILGFTGAYWNIMHLVQEGLVHDDSAEYHLQGRLYNDELSFDRLQQQAEAAIDGFRATYISLPYNPQRPFVFYGDVSAANPLLSQYANQVTFDAQSGELLDRRDIRNQGVLVKIDDSFRRLHFGDFGGVLVKLIWCLSGLVALWLGYTGVSVWWSKQSAKRRARQKRAARQVDPEVAVNR
ncbi:PepSY-associated TM helix domain-containing protein [Bacterioplanoides pacificum]|uniref:PepSY-associated TM helix domain-containing protein n=1 Tax=Bacterioplanoides pacificum TaxID=1171596 RepID=A0ABV7VPQ6_9GAMM